jgi:orotate phosphoribosyltransferase
MFLGYAVGFNEKYTTKELYDKVAQGMAKNVKMGPFKATSGIILPYYLNATTNFLDKHMAPLVMQIMTDYLHNYILPLLPSGEEVLIVGMEVAGGILVSQLASNATKLGEWADFCYVRKSQKESGTQQQLEGPNEFTLRTPKSKELLAIWIDDALSTGDSLVHGIAMLKTNYNIRVIQSLYLCDRSKDRVNLKEQKITDEVEKACAIHAIFDLKEIDQLIPKM